MYLPFGELLKGSYTTEDMLRIFDEQNFIKKFLTIEAALAKAQAELGVVPKEAADAIEALSQRGLDPKKIAETKGKARHLLVSMMYTAADELGDYGEYIHLGPTTQDILDTSLILLSKEALDVMIKDLKKLIEILIDKAEKYKYTVMPGRTHSQHAVPITFGLKLAFWADELKDHIKRLQDTYERITYLHLSGAVDTMASFVQVFNGDKDKVFKMHELVAKYLGLKPIYIGQHQRIDKFSEIVTNLSLISSLIGRIGLEIRDLSAEEVKEVFEPWTKGMHSSSTMPQKRNPEPSEWLEGIAKIVRVLPVSMNSITMQHERDATRMAPEFLVLPLAFTLVHAQVKSVTRIIEGLQVFEDNMRKNLYISRGFMAAEPLMLELAKRTGKKVTAHKIIYDIVQDAINANKTFEEAVLANAEIRKYFTENELRELLNMEKYIGTSAEQVERIKSVIEKEIFGR
jgi:adenylosuccinate lyase